MEDTSMTLVNIATSSPTKVSSSSKVIESLHAKIDMLTEELSITKANLEEITKKHQISSKRCDSYVDQLANSHHENDVLTALLKRKERRIIDLENSHNELIDINEGLKLNYKNLSIRCENLQENNMNSMGEYERLKISYDALLSGQHEYKNYYKSQIDHLQNEFDKYKLESEKKYQLLNQDLNKNDKDIDTLLDSLVNKRTKMDNIYVSKNNQILELLSTLATATKLHGQESKSVLEQNVNVINELVAMFPDMEQNLQTHLQATVNIDELLGETQQVLEDQAQLEDEEISSPVTSTTNINTSTTSISRNNTLKKRRNRNSIRIESRNVTPTVNNNIINLPKSRGVGSVKPSGANSAASSPRLSMNGEFESHGNFHSDQENTNNNNYTHRRSGSVNYHRRQYSNTGNINYTNNGNSGYGNGGGRGRNSSNVSANGNVNGYGHNYNNNGNANYSYNNNANANYNNSNGNVNYNNTNSNGNSNNNRQKRRSYTQNTNKRNSQMFEHNLALTG
ncbi:SHE3 [[Candida] subhashii]|uniref:SWI5-dependent HO expression protein 3 n=1 Tax=[Candida] subhashii TaxID=561895 RepID=A0A8J5QFS1_9ASCO|nr:SHE3 [[Candida] subhashii]KAG7662142.1 SHE3 [[Candida] subhashii]